MGPGQHGVLGPGASDRRQLLALRPQRTEPSEVHQQRTRQPGVDLRETRRALLVVQGEQQQFLGQGERTFHYPAPCGHPIDVGVRAVRTAIRRRPAGSPADTLRLCSHFRSRLRYLWYFFHVTGSIFRQIPSENLLGTSILPTASRRA